MTKQHTFTQRRWRMLILYALINLCAGSVYSWSVFAIPLQAQLQTDNLTVAYTVAVSIGPITMISGGFLQRTFGTRRILVFSGLLYGLSMLAASCTSGFWPFFLTYGWGCGLAIGLAYGAAVSNSVQMFPDRRGLAGGIAAATYGGSAIIVPPIANAMILQFGAITSFRILAIVILVVISVCGFFIEECPENFVPDGWTPPQNQSPSGGVNWKQMISTPLFYVMLLLLLCGAVSGTTVVSQASSIAQHLVGMGTASAAIMVSTLSAFNAGGRVASGWLSDRIGRINTLTLMLCISLLGLFLISTSKTGSYVQFAIGMASIGLGYGAFLGVFPSFTADRFGQKHQSVNYGIMFIGFSIAGLTAPNIASAVYAGSGSYQPAFLLAAVLCVIGLVLTFIYRKL